MSKANGKPGKASAKKQGRQKGKAPTTKKDGFDQLRAGNQPLSMPGTLFSKQSSSAQSSVFWDPRAYPTAPALNTSFGNYAPVQSFTEVSFKNDTGLHTLYIVTWSRSGICGFGAQYDPAGATNRNLGGGTTPVPWVGALKGGNGTAIRPLKMSCTLMNTTNPTSRQGTVRCLAVDQSVAFQYFPGALGVNQVLGNDTYLNAIGALTDSKSTRVYSADFFHTPKTFVSPPVSYIKYNSYEDFKDSGQPLGSQLNTDMAWYLAQSDGMSDDLAPVIAFSFNDKAWLREVPPLRRWLFVIPPTTVQQNYTLTVSRLDGVRYPANTLGDAFTVASKPSNKQMADRTDKLIEQAIATVTPLDSTD